MPICYSDTNHMIAVFGDSPIKKYRPIISKELISKFGKGPFSAAQVTNALFFAFDWYSKQFLDILNRENQLAFYQGIFLLHEDSCEFRKNTPNISPHPEFSDIDFALYRRVLKLSLEQACDIPLKGNHIFSPEYFKRKERIIEELLYLGCYIYDLSNILASQHMVEDCIDLKYTENNLFYFDNKHHYGFILDKLLISINEHRKKVLECENNYSDILQAFDKCLGVNINQLRETIRLIHDNFRDCGGKIVLDEWIIYPKNLENLFGIPYEKGEIFIKGLTLSKENKMPLKESVYRPQNLNRYLYRPFLIWNVDGKDLTIIGNEIFDESILALLSNNLSWNKYPIEWENDCFKSIIQQLSNQNDKILENKVEKLLKENAIIYDRNITHFLKWNNQNEDIETGDCGELDFIFLYDNHVFIADCKHQTARFDMNNFKNDYSSFETGKKAYNKTLTRKLLYLKTKISSIEEHFQVLLENRALKITATSLTGIFIVKTPTFIMFNNEYRIYPILDFEEFVTGKFIDKKFTLFINEEDQSKLISIEYPYFKKPNYSVFDLDIEED